MDSSEITLEAVSSISQVTAEEWDACANQIPDPGSLEGLDTLASPGNSCTSFKRPYNPFVSHAFSRRWKPPDQLARGPDGARAICSRAATAQSLESSPAI